MSLKFAPIVRSFVSSRLDRSFFLSFRVRNSKFLGFSRPEFSSVVLQNTAVLFRVPDAEENYKITSVFNFIATLGFLFLLFTMLLHWLEEDELY